MKKIFLVFAIIFFMCGCSMGNMENTPTRQVENYLNKYQSLDKSVLEDLDNILMGDSSLNDSERNEYRDFMKKHYQDLQYEIKNETIDGDNANVQAEVTVRDYTNAINSANDYKNQNESKFQTDGNYDPTLFSSYRLSELKKVRGTTTYTILFTLVKKDGKWVLNQPSDEDLNKINGLYVG